MTPEEIFIGIILGLIVGAPLVLISFAISVMAAVILGDTLAYLLRGVARLWSRS